MYSITLIVAVILAGSWLINLLCALYFVWVPLRAQPIAAGDEQLKKFCVGMPLRGADPHLRDAIHSILKQDYPEFELHIVVDSQEDPAWAVASDAINDLRADNVTMTPLQSRSKTCSLYADYSRRRNEVTQLIAGTAQTHRMEHDNIYHLGIANSDRSSGTNSVCSFRPTRWRTGLFYLPTEVRNSSLTRPRCCPDRRQSRHR